MGREGEAQEVTAADSAAERASEKSNQRHAGSDKVDENGGHERDGEGSIGATRSTEDTSVSSIEETEASGSGQANRKRRSMAPKEYENKRYK